jgi:hypothetical protein
MGTILAMAGPLPLIAYLVRYAAVRVAIEPAGLRLSDRYFVRWSEIRSVERRGSRAEPLRLMEGVDLPLPVWILVSFLVVMTGFIFLLVLFWLLQSIVAPVFVLLSPWQRGVAIRLHDGTTLLYRDLSDADEFVSRVAQQIPA